ncbi:TetR/AcrR family transcriptional regulator [Frankia sp. R82]|uniref:TetR/AcrR family transcriptional regulator n=1 Tax=Frankia sp. R82 TaxID=2950553 RepID=UPI00204429E0|nr:TetR/AcrR family transcriptional regulator [Frankia sp. R82]MCM3885392.1 TetR/AcrR family transcriptional regulator [Frankia sp. R82]
MTIGTDAPHAHSPQATGRDGGRDSGRDGDPPRTAVRDGAARDGAAPEGTVRDAVVLDAAKASLLAVGVRRTTLTEVARRAGTSRMTLYRRWPDLRTLVGEVMTREWSSIVTAAARLARRDPHSRDLDGIVDQIVATVDAFRANPVYRRILETDAEMLLPYLTERRGTTQQMIVDLLAGQLGAAARAGTVRSGDPEALAVMVLLVAQSYVLSADALGGRVGAATRHGELRRLLHAYLAPAPAQDPDLESDPERTT